MIDGVDGFPRTPYSMARVGGIWPGSVAVYVCRTKLAPNGSCPPRPLILPQTPLANERLPPSLSPFEFPRPFVTFVSVFFRYAAAGKC